MPRKPLNSKGVKKVLGYRIDPDIHEWLSNNGKTKTVERLVRDEMYRLNPELIPVEEPEEEPEDYISEYD